MGDEYTARRAPRDTKIDVKFPDANPSAPAARPVAPPKSKPSLADLRKQAGG